MRNFFKWIGLLILILIVLFVFYPNLLLRVPEPIRSGTLSLPDLGKPVTVIFDEYAVPHVYAENEHDLFYAASYVMASERLFQMDLVNRAVRGRLAEMNAGLLNADKYLRTWGFHHIGKQMAAAMAPETRQIVQWACDGINHYIDTHVDDLPLEFRLAGHEPLPWEPAIVCGYARLMGHELNLSWALEMVVGRLMEVYGEEMTRDIIPAYPDDRPFVVPAGVSSFAPLAEPIMAAHDQVKRVLGEGGGFSGSNNWVLSGERTTTGRPILANDPHLDFTQPAKWYEIHLIGGRFNTRGVCLPGLPLPVLGHNEHIAWGFTNVMADDADFYEEQVNPRDSSRYLHRSEWLPFTERKETIQVKGGEPVILIVQETVHGVVINDRHAIAGLSDKPVTMRWTGQDVTDEVAALIKLNLARNWEEFSAAARLFTVPGQNVVYADRVGNIGWRPFVRLPVRKGGSGLLVMPGASGEWDWQGYVPFEEMPYRYNPPEGCIATANNKTIGPEFPYYISAYWVPPARIERILELVADRREHSLESCAAIQNDYRSTHAREVLPFLLAACAEEAGNAGPTLLEKEALEQLRRWDFVMSTESVPAAIFNTWFVELVPAIYRDEMDQAGDHFYTNYLKLGGLLPYRSVTYLLQRGESPWFDNLHTPEVETRDDIIRQAFRAAVSRLSEELGKRIAKWHWGKVHTLTHPHDLAGAGTLGKFLNWWLGLNVGPFPFPGGNATVNPGAYSLDNPFAITAGASVRRIIDLSDWDHSLAVLPSGQSGAPFSRHYRDQAELFNAGEYRSADFSREAVEQNAHSTLILQP
ncbi:MAG: penicillin acylase family protein [Candidatus Neomarinimicrobiota bacterium]